MRGDLLVERLPCRLTPAEKAQRADELARRLARKDELAAEKAGAVRTFAGALKDVDREIAALSEQVRTGVERREVELAERPDYALGVVLIYRTDTGEVVRTRAIEPAERQQALFAEAEADMRRSASEDDPGDESSAH